MRHRAEYQPDENCTDRQPDQANADDAQERKLQRRLGGELREHGWAQRSNDWVDILVLRFEDLGSLIPQMARFLDLPDLALPRKNVTATKPGAADVASAWKAALGKAETCARELRTSAYGRACGYDRLA